MRLPIPAIVLALALVACTPETTTPATVTVSTTAVAFGDVSIDRTASSDLSVTNTGTVPLQVYSLTLVQGDSALFRVDTSGAQDIAGGATAVIPLTFAPRAEGTVSGRLQLRTSDTATGPVAITLTGTGTASEADDDDDGYSPASGDCDDSRADVHPNADEACDGRDNDCDGTVPASEADDDHDGFRLCDDDCDDTSAQIYPGAPERCDDADTNCDGRSQDRVDVDADGQSICDGDCDDDDDRVGLGFPEVCDGVDNNCDGGVDDLDADNDGHTTCHAAPDCDDANPAAYPVIVDPSAASGGDGTEATPFQSLADALPAMDDVCRTVYVTAGTVDAGLTLSGPMTLVGAGADLTTLTAPAGTRALRITGGDVTLASMAIRDASAGEDGAALRVEGGTVVIRHMTFDNNETTGGDGGAIAVSGGTSLVVEDSVFSDNHSSDDGGAIAVFSGTASVTRSAFTGNQGADGGAMLFSADTLTIDHTSFSGDTATGSGGALHAASGDVTLRSVTVAGASALGSGGGVALDHVTGVIRNAQLIGNHAGDIGGGLAVLTTTNPLLVLNSTFVLNSTGAGEGAAVAVSGDDVSLISLLGQGNEGPSACWIAPTAARSTTTYSTFFGTVGADWAGLCVGSDLGNTTVNPQFTDLLPGASATEQDLTLTAGSPAIDSGPPDAAYRDDDGTRNDRGWTGGPTAP